MLNKLSINIRVLMLILIPAIILVTIGYYSHLNYKKNESHIITTTVDLNIIKAGRDLNSAINNHYTYILDKLKNGRATWQASTNKAVDGEKILMKSFANYNSAISKNSLTPTLKVKLTEAEKDLKFDYAFMKKFLLNRTGSKDDMNVLAAYLPENQLRYSQNMEKVIKKIDDVLLDNINSNTVDNAEAAFTDSQTITTLIVIASILMFIIGFLISRSIQIPIKELKKVVTGFAKGDFRIRSVVIGTDEIANLSSTFNSLLDDRAVTLKKIDEEHRELNESVFSLLQAVAELSERDLTKRANVTEDATGH